MVDEAGGKKRKRQSMDIVSASKKIQKSKSGTDDIEIGDEILITRRTVCRGQELKSGIWIVRSFRSGSVVLQRHYNDQEMLEEGVVRPLRFDRKELHKKLASKSVQLVKAKATPDKSNLQGICLRFISRNRKMYLRKIRELPLQIQQAICDYRDASEIIPIPIEFRIRALASKSNRSVHDSPRMNKLTRAGASEWTQRTWRFVPQVGP
jgi:hypothetical protein